MTPFTSDHPTIQNLPEILLTWIPELTKFDWPHEALATCDTCPLVAPRPENLSPATPFTAPANCCVMHPNLPNHAAGAALAREGVSHDAVFARIEQLDNGITPMGITKGKIWETSNPVQRRCPFHTLSDAGCGIWQNRPAACRAWFCRSVEGSRGLSLWAGLRQTLEKLEEHLALECVRAGHPPDGDASPSDWVQWYLWCHAHVSSQVNTPPSWINRERQTLRALHIQRTMPAVLAPTAPEFTIEDEQVLFRVPNDTRGSYPRSVFQLLALLDGTRPWQEALQRAASDHTNLSTELLHDLFHAGIVSAPVDLKLDWSQAVPASVNQRQSATPAILQKEERSVHCVQVTPTPLDTSGDPVTVSSLFDTCIALCRPPKFEHWRTGVLTEIQRRREQGAFEVVADFQQHFSPDNPAFHFPFETRRWIHDPLLDTGHVVHTWTGSAIEEMFHWLKQGAQKAAQQLGLEHRSMHIDTLWSHITKVGGEMALHAHGGASNQPLIGFSVICYLQLDPPDQAHPHSGAVRFVDDAWEREFLFQPEEGLCLAVPTHIRHEILPYYGERERIIVAGNVVFGN